MTDRRRTQVPTAFEIQKAAGSATTSPDSHSTTKQEQKLPQQVLDVMDDIKKQWSFTQSDDVNSTSISN